MTIECEPESSAASTPATLIRLPTQTGGLH